VNTRLSGFAIVRMPVSLALVMLIAAIAPSQNVAKNKSASVNRNFAESDQPDSPRGGALARIPMDSNPLFLPPVAYASPAPQVSSLAVADLNGDGKLDVVATNYENPGLTVWLGNGDGTFQAATTISLAGFFSSTNSVAIGDLNGDGIPDLAVAQSAVGGEGYGAVAILLGNGDGTFQSPREISALVPALAIRIADLNRDGKPDLVVGESVGGEVFFGTGDGTFKSNGGLGTFDAASYSVAVADVNKDGWPDILLSDSSGELELILNNGDGTFAFAVQVSAGLGQVVWWIAAADVNGDGNPDLITANQCGKHCQMGVSVILGNGDGTFQPAVEYPAGRADSSGAVALADVNGDGHLDILYTDVGLAVLLGNGDGTFQQAQSYGSGFHGVAADVNGDGRPDVISALGTGMEVAINNTGPHQPSTTALTSDAAPAAPDQVVTYTATITSQYAGGVTGSVTFTDKGKTIGSAPVANNAASISLSYPKTGKHPIVATYSGDYYSSVSTSPAFAEYIENLPVASATHVTTSGSPSQLGQPVTFTAAVTSTFGSIPDGELVTFSDGNTVLGTAPLAGGSAAFTTSALTAKKHTVNADYAGDAVFKPSHGHVIQVVQP
jgi:Bacterial Ig-like domain (group 3)/FG-GAP-like repeat